jgi:hypothetical protein
MGEENGQKIYMIKKRYGTMWQIISVKGKPLKIKGSDRAHLILKRLEGNK